MNVRLIVADTNPAVRRSLSLVAKTTPGVEYVGTAQHAEELRTLADAERPDLVLIEASILAATARALRLALPGIKLILILAANEEISIAELHAAGATAYIRQQAHSDAIRQAVQAAIEGNHFEDEQVGVHPVHPAAFFQLGERELQLLHALITHEDSRAAQVLGISRAEFDLYVSSVMAKLSVESLEGLRERAKEQALIS